MKGVGPFYALEAKALYESGRIQEARSRLDRALATGNLPAGFYLLSARIFSDLGRMDDAVEEMTAALKKAGPDPVLYAWRAQFNMLRRQYGSAFKDLKRAIGISPHDARLHVKMSELLELTNRLSAALASLEKALRLKPQDPEILRARLRVLIRRGDLKRAQKEIEGMRGGDAWEPFYQGLLHLKKSEWNSAVKNFEKAMEHRDRSLTDQARAYWIGAKLKEKYPPEVLSMNGADNTRIYLCGLGLFPPRTTTVEALHALSRCDVVFNNRSEAEVSEFLAGFCKEVVPAAFTDTHDSQFWMKRILSEVKKGRTVGFATRGHALMFGGLAYDLIEHCKKAGIVCRALPAVSNIDYILTQMAQVLGHHFKGIQAFDCSVFSGLRALDRRQPLLVYFYQGFQKGQVPAFRSKLERFFPPGQDCWMFGPQYQSPPAAFKLKRLDKEFPEIHPSLILYIPGVRS